MALVWPTYAGPAFTFVTGIASIAGAVLSWLAWQSAKTAVAAAQAARRAARREHAAESLRNLNHSASELLGFVQNDQLQAATVRARDLFSEIRMVRDRWDRFLSGEGRERLEQAQLRAKRIATSIALAHAPVDPPVKQKTLEYCHFVVDALSRETSTITARIETEEE